MPAEQWPPAALIVVTVAHTNECFHEQEKHSDA